MKRLFLFFLLLPALSFAQNLEQIEGRLTVLESIVSEPVFVVVDSAGVEIGTYVADGSSVGLTSTSTGIGISAPGALIEVDVAGRIALFRAVSIGGQSILWPWFSTVYASTDCTGQPYILLGKQSFLGLNSAYDVVSLQANIVPPQLLEPALGASPQFADSVFFQQQVCEEIFNLVLTRILSSEDRVILASAFMLDATPFVFALNFAGIPNFGVHQPPFVLRRATKTQANLFQ